MRLWLLAASLLLVQPSPLRSQGSGSDEYRLKAAFLYRFPQFVEWPPAALQGRGALEICVSQPNPFGSALRDLVRGESLGGRALQVRDVAYPEALDGCHVLFISGTAAEARALLAEAARRPLLTVGESPGFLDDGGTINLLVVDRRIRFEVNNVAATRAGLRLSSQLLRLAVRVRGAAS